MNTVRGRVAEQGLVRDLLLHAQRGSGSVLLVEGEPGIGKSAFLRDAVGAAAGLGFSLAAGAADPLDDSVLPVAAGPGRVVRQDRRRA
jgi:KaiC/GvpD/RAD55 family RecA-like ATPase